MVSSAMPEWCRYAPTEEIREAVDELTLYQWLRTLAPEDISFLIFEGDLNEAEADDLRKAYAVANGGINA